MPVFFPPQAMKQTLREQKQKHKFLQRAHNEQQRQQPASQCADTAAGK